MKQVMVTSVLFYTGLLTYTVQVALVVKAAQERLTPSSSTPQEFSEAFSQINQDLIGISLSWLMVLGLGLMAWSLYTWFVTREK